MQNAICKSRGDRFAENLSQNRFLRKISGNVKIPCSLNICFCFENETEKITFKQMNTFWIQKYIQGSLR